MTPKEEKARALFREGYNCAQSVTAAFCEEMGMEKSQLLRLSSPFGGGMGRMREVCGAVSGMFLALGAIYGYDIPGDLQVKKELYTRVQDLAARYREENGSIICRELLGIEGKDCSPVPSERTEDYYKRRPCEAKVGAAARLLEEYMKEHPLTE